MAPPQPPQAADMPPMPSMMPMLVSMLLIFGLYIIDGSEHIIGKVLNYGLGIFSFDGKIPVLTLMMVGAIMATLSTVIRSLATDMLTQAKNQSMMSSFNNELRQARLEQNMYKMKKLTAMQPQMMSKNMESSASMMKIMPYTMIIVVPMFLWVRYFVYVTLPETTSTLVSVPWATGVDLAGSLWFMPVWIVMYTLVSIPLGHILNRIIRGYKFKKHLATIEQNETAFEMI